MPTRLPTWKKALFGLLVTSFVAVPAFLLLDVIYAAHSDWIDLDALTSPRRDTNPNALWSHADPFSAYTGIPGTHLQSEVGSKTINRHGFISTPAIDVAKSPGVVRLVFLGESSTAGPELADVQTWPWRVVEHLRQEPGMPPIEFINGALAGYTSFESIGRLWSRIRFFSPDVVIVYHGWNELYYFNSSTVGHIERWRADAAVDWGIPAELLTPPLYRPLFIDRFIAWSTLLSTLRIRLSTPTRSELGRTLTPSAAEQLPEEWDARGLEVWRTNLQVLREITKLFGAELAVVKQATLLHPGLPEHERKRCMVALHGFGYAAHLQAFDALWRVVDEEIAGPSVIDARSLSGQPSGFKDHIHQTASGAEALAKLVAVAIAPRVRARSQQQGATP